MEIRWRIEDDLHIAHAICKEDHGVILHISRASKHFGCRVGAKCIACSMYCVDGVGFEPCRSAGNEELGCSKDGNGETTVNRIE